MGGGGYLKNWDPIINVGMILIRCASSEDTRAECPTYGITEIGTMFNVIRSFASAEGASL